MKIRLKRKLLETYFLNIKSKFDDYLKIRFKKIKILESDRNIRFCPKEDCENYVKRENERDLKLVCICG
jgi:hypothetical protein